VFEAIMRAPFVPGAIELLRFLDARSIPAFIASGTPHDELQNIVRLRDLNPWFRAVFGTPASKDEILKNILSAYDLRADLVLFIGDATTDHIAARNSGVNFLARNTPALEKYWNEHHVVTTENLAYAIEAYEWH
jgi:phosphoglycolate phosphatase-like HAD superfamily hydrolase